MIQVSRVDPLICASAMSFLQTPFWGAFKAEFGWEPRHFVVDTGTDLRPMLVLLRRMARVFTFAYVPHGPEIDLPAGSEAERLAMLADALRPQLPSSCLFIRFEPPMTILAGADESEPGAGSPADEDDGASASSYPEPPRPMIGAPLLRAQADVQVPDTVILDLHGDEAALLARMKSKWRYNIRLAERKGVTVEEAGAQGIGEFYGLYALTAARDGIALHPQRYYERLFSLAAERADGPDIRLWIARHEGSALAAIITLFRNGKAVYLYGASSDEKRSLMPAYALQWAAMNAARAAGCGEYDLFGIPPNADPNHPMAGLYRFKTGFGGSIAHRAGSWDYPYRVAPYLMFRIAESLRRWYFKEFRKRKTR